MVEFSVVIPTKNRAAMTVRAVRSALGQSYAPAEVIVVDDGSRPDTVDAVRALKDKRVRLMHTNRFGPARARNVGTRAAKSPYVAFLDSDDVWLQGKLEKQARVLEAEPETVLLFGNALLVDARERGGQAVFDRQRPSEGQIFRPMLLDNFVPTSSVVVRRDSLLGIGGFRKQFEPAEDYDAWLRLALTGPARLIPETTLYYTRHDHQLGGDIPRMFHACVEVIENALAEAKLTMDDVPGLRRRLWQLHVVAAREAFRRGKTAMAGDHWDRAVRLKPWDWRTRLGRTWPGRYWQSRRSPIVGAVL